MRMGTSESRANLYHYLVHNIYHFHSRQDPLVEFEFQEIKDAISFERTVASSFGWISLLTSPGNRRRLRIIVALAMFSQWSGNGLV